VIRIASPFLPQPVRLRIDPAQLRRIAALRHPGIAPLRQIKRRCAAP